MFIEIESIRALRHGQLLLIDGGNGEIAIQPGVLTKKQVHQALHPFGVELGQPLQLLKLPRFILSPHKKMAFHCEGYGDLDR